MYRSATRRNLSLCRLPLALLSAGVLSVAVLTGCGGGDDTPEEPTPVSFTLSRIGGYNGGAPAAAEITAYDATTERLFVVNGAIGTVDVLNLADPTQPALVGTINVGVFGDTVNSVSTYNGLIAVAIQASPKTDPGTVAFYNASNLSLLGHVTVGSQPDMLTFTPDGSKVIVANEGEPDSYGGAKSVDPEGSVSIITVNGGTNPTVATADFKAFIGQEAALRALGVRIFGPGANAAQDFEPEYIAVSENSAIAYVTLQENNAIAVVDIAAATVLSVKPLGTKDHNLAGNGLDASDEDGGTDTNSGTPSIKIANYPVRGMYQPDAISRFTIDGKTYLVTANEGEARADWPGYSDETRVRTHCAAGLDPTVFPNASTLIRDSNLGRLRVTANPTGDGTTGKNGAGECTELYSFGARSFTIWDSDIMPVWDSGDQFEQRTTTLPNALFNANHETHTLDGRSANKGPEPEGVSVGKIGKKTFAFVGLERIGGVMAYDVSTPTAPNFVTYLNLRTSDTGELGPEGVLFIPAAKSPNGKPLVILGHEISGTTAILQVDATY